MKMMWPLFKPYAFWVVLQGNLNMSLFLSFIAAAISFIALDMLWLGVIAKKYYHEKLGHLMANNYVWQPVLVFYLLYMGGIVYFAITPALKAGNWHLATLNGAILGLLCYGTYDLVNHGTLRDWPWQITFLDIVWGTFLSATAATVGYFVAGAVK